MKRSIIVICLTAAMGVNLSAQTHPATLTGITQVNLNAAIASATQERNIVIQGVRIASDTTDLDDFINLTYTMDASSLALVLSEIAVYPDVGVADLDESLFMKDVNADFTLTRNGQVYQSRTTYTITANADEPFHARLDAGTSLTFCLRNASSNYRYIVKKADDGTILRNSYFLRGSSWTAWKTPILASGEYLVYFQAEDSSPMTLEMKASNDNRFQLTNLHDQDSFSASFAQQSGDYAKWRIFLNKDETLTVTKASSTGYTVWCWLFFEDSTKFVNGGFDTFAFVARQTGYYYLVAQMTSAVDGSCAGTISISSKTPGPVVRTARPLSLGGNDSMLGADTDGLSAPASAASLLRVRSLSVGGSTAGHAEQ